MPANTRLDSLHDLVKLRANLRVTCACGRIHVYDAGRFCRFALVRRWNVQLEALAHRVRCGACGRRGPALKAVPDPPTAADPFPRTEQEWRLLARGAEGLMARLATRSGANLRFTARLP